MHLTSLICQGMKQNQILDDLIQQRNRCHSPKLDPQQTSLARRLKQSQLLDPDQYNAPWIEIFASDRKLIISQQDYGMQHKQRFRELFNALLKLTTHQQAPKVLEFGVYEVSNLYSELILKLNCIYLLLNNRRLHRF